MESRGLEFSLVAYLTLRMDSHQSHSCQNLVDKYSNDDNFVSKVRLMSQLHNAQGLLEILKLVSMVVAHYFRRNSFVRPLFSLQKPLSVIKLLFVT